MPELSRTTQERLQRYMVQARLQPGQLVAQLEQGRDRFLRSSAGCEFADRPLALRLYKGFERLLSQPLAEENWPWVQAAMAYLLEADDEENDLDSPLGLEDDAEVFNDVCVALGYSELKVDLA